MPGFRFIVGSLTTVVVLLSCSVLPEVADAGIAFKSAPRIKVALISNHQSVSTGQEILIGVYQKIDPHWHTYWRNPGDSGLAPTMKWSLPKGVTVSPFAWPVPHKIFVKHLANFGYESEVLLMSKLKVPSNFKESQLKLSGTFTWLVCREECIPGKAVLSFSIPVVPKSKTKHSSYSSLFKKFQNELPKLGSTIQFKIVEKKKSIQLTFVPSPDFRTQWKPKAFYPITVSILNDAAKQKFVKHGNGWSLTVPKNAYFLGKASSLRGLLIVDDRSGKSKHIGFSVSPPQTKPTPTSRPVPVATTASAKSREPAPNNVGDSSKKKSTSAVVGSTSIIPLSEVFAGWKPYEKSNSNPSDGTLFAILQALFFALLGGLILNLMPCVFPVLSIKVLHFMEQSEQESSSIRMHGIAFWLGIQFSFTALASVLIALRASGSMIGWGFQLQHPPIIFLLAAVMFVMGLSLSGLFEVGSSLMGVGDNLASKSGYTGSFFTGVLATIVATPCTAPLMGAAIAYALVQPVWVGLLVFNGLGLGMASPYLALSFFPSLLKKMPRPGAWMERLKQILAFPLYGAGIWLLWVLGKQAGKEGIITALIALLIVSFGCWLYGNTRLSNRSTDLAFLSMLFVLAGSAYGYRQSGKDAIRHIAQQKRVSKGLQLLAQSEGSKTAYGTKLAYSRKQLAIYLKKGDNVLLNLTAAWCISCKVNEQVALSTQSVKAALRKYKIRYIVGDWTHRDKDIAQILERFKRNGVPLYLLFHGKSRRYLVLPQLLTPGIVKERIQRIHSSPS